jgi:hypothetical protein
MFHDLKVTTVEMKFNTLLNIYNQSMYFKLGTPSIPRSSIVFFQLDHESLCFHRDFFHIIKKKSLIRDNQVRQGQSPIIKGLDNQGLKNLITLSFDNRTRNQDFHHFSPNVTIQRTKQFKE